MGESILSEREVPVLKALAKALLAKGNPVNIPEPGRGYPF